MNSVRDFCSQYQSEAAAAVSALDLAPIETAIAWLQAARQEGHRIFTCGNGGSASTASHLATDLVKGASYQKSSRFRVQALTDSLSTLTAYANDVAYQSVFVEQLKNDAAPGDLLFCISGSGRSPSVIEAARYARSVDCRVIALTGRDGGELAPLADLHIATGQPHMGHIEDLHLLIAHMIAYRFIDLEA